ncbi:MAG: F0F1 ATP synthase subunit gamma [Gammaproteobacteria bacterium]|nr:F0F1 ATP synthase subunit gamma [Gammaproteobacteria bacterium]
MTKQSKITSHLNSLRNIRVIITAMKNLALIETAKISRFLPLQTKLVSNIESVATDFFSFYPQYLANIKQEKTAVYILLGSERGFCGEFNEVLLKTWQKNLNTNTSSPAKAIGIGTKLTAKIGNGINFFKQLAGPSTVEEIPSIILTLVKNLANINPTRWTIICNSEQNNILTTQLFRPFAQINFKQQATFASPPVLNLQPEDFFTKLFDEYLLAVLYKVFYHSFLIENTLRSQHMDGALQWLDKSADKLTLAMNASRQEEITEGIEEIMLNVEFLSKL